VPAVNFVTMTSL